MPLDGSTIKKKKQREKHYFVFSKEFDFMSFCYTVLVLFYECLDVTTNKTHCYHIKEMFLTGSHVFHFVSLSGMAGSLNVQLEVECF